MKLKNPKDAPPGGFYFKTDTNATIRSSSLRDLIIAVENRYAADGIPLPSDLSQIIEDQICARLPNGSCWKGAGDFTANVIQAAAGAVDALLGTTLQEKAQRCGSCGKRKRAMNRL